MKIKKSTHINNPANEALEKLIKETNFPIQNVSIIASHTIVTPFHQAIYFYPQGYPREYHIDEWKPEPGFKKVFNINIAPTNSCCLDWGNFPDRYTNIFAQTPTEIYPIGAYGKWKNQEMLIFTDISHAMCSFSIAVFKEIINLIKELNWKEIEQAKINAKITIGADPEMELVSNGNICPANVFYPSTSGEIGADGAGTPLEIRPKAANKPQQLIKNIENLLKKIAAEGHSFETKGDKYSIGCHIHFGNGITPDKNFLKLLDNWLYHPLSFLNGTKRGSYAQPSQYETKEYGFEYRSLPSGFLASKPLTLIVFKIAYLLANEYFNGNEVETTPTSEDYIQLLGEKDANIFFNTINELKTLNLPTYTPMFLASWKISKRNNIKVSAASTVAWPYLNCTQFKIPAKNEFFVLLLPGYENFFVESSNKLKPLKAKIEKYFLSIECVQSPKQLSFPIADLAIGVPDDVRTDKTKFTNLMKTIFPNSKELENYLHA